MLPGDDGVEIDNLSVEKFKPLAALIRYFSHH
jgi:hypothetical protein